MLNLDLSLLLAMVLSLWFCWLKVAAIMVNQAMYCLIFGIGMVQDLKSLLSTLCWKINVIRVENHLKFV